jgi:hypothetical protein
MKETHEQHKTKIDLDEFRSGTTNITLYTHKLMCMNSYIQICTYKRGWLYGMEMDSYKSQILDGVLVQKRNRMSQCLKLHASVSQFFSTKRTHSRVPGLMGEALFLKL